MFSIVIDYEDGYLLINLLYKTNDGIVLDFSIDNPELITDINIDDTGEFDPLSINGVCSFRWTPDTLIFNLGTYSCGGDLSVKIPATSENIASLKQCLQAWKDAVINMESK